ncbi:MAG: hypothetical protein DRN20_04935 [Thermoplasmata archaeon]|nr:MAG: hypothetical protein DRN20_04935 [Thermoplasmata archaeon]
MTSDREILIGSIDFLRRLVAESYEVSCEDERKQNAGRLLKLLCFQATDMNSALCHCASQVDDALDKILELKRKVSELCGDLERLIKEIDGAAN